MRSWCAEDVHGYDGVRTRIWIYMALSIQVTVWNSVLRNVE